MNTVAEAISTLRAADWRPGVSTAEHPARSEIKAALAVLRQHHVDVEKALEGAADEPLVCPLCGSTSAPPAIAGSTPAAPAGKVRKSAAKG